MARIRCVVERITYHKEVFNGDIGIIVSVNADDRTLKAAAGASTFAFIFAPVSALSGKGSHGRASFAVREGFREIRGKSGLYHIAITLLFVLWYSLKKIREKHDP